MFQYTCKFHPFTVKFHYVQIQRPREDELSPRQLLCQMSNSSSNTRCWIKAVNSK